MKYAIIRYRGERVEKYPAGKNLNSEESAKRIDAALAETRVDYEVNIEKQCVVVMGNSDMVAVARKVINDLGFMIL